MKRGFLALLAAVLATPSFAAGTDCRIGSYALGDGRNLDIGPSEGTALRWRLEDGTTGKLTPAGSGRWISTLGWTDRPDGKTVTFDCDRGTIRFAQVSGKRIPFDVTETRFRGAGVDLAGRLILPRGAGKVPIVILIHGSEHDSGIANFALQRQFAARGITLLGRAVSFDGGAMRFAPDVRDNIALGDENYLSMLRRADDYIARNGLDFPEEPEAHEIGPMPACVTDPILELDLKKAGITSIVWATGYAPDFGWLKADAFNNRGRPVHKRGVSNVPGLYFLGLPWLSRRASSFIWGVWHDAAYLADRIADAHRETDAMPAAAAPSSV